MPGSCEGGNQGCVNRELRPSPQWEAVGNDLNSPVVLGVNVVNVEVNDSGVGGHNQTGVVRDGVGDSRTFDIFSSVRERCVLTPRLFCAAFELAMSEWRLANPHSRVDLGWGCYASFV